MIPKIGDIVRLNPKFVQAFIDYEYQWVTPFIGKRLQVINFISNVAHDGSKLNETFAYYSIRFKIAGTSGFDPKTQCNVGIDLKGCQHEIEFPVFIANIMN